MNFFPQVKNWKTTASGLVFAAALFVSSSGLDVPPWLSKTLKGLQAVSIVSLGASAKDFNVSGDPPHQMEDPK